MIRNHVARNLNQLWRCSTFFVEERINNPSSSMHLFRGWQGHRNIDNLWKPMEDGCGLCHEITSIDGSGGVCTETDSERL